MSNEKLLRECRAVISDRGSPYLHKHLLKEIDAALATQNTPVPDDRYVICPNCAHQFQAISVSDQLTLAERDAEIARLREDGPCRHEWYQGACAHCHMDVDVFNAERKERG